MKSGYLTIKLTLTKTRDNSKKIMSCIWWSWKRVLYSENQLQKPNITIRIYFTEWRNIPEGQVETVDFSLRGKFVTV